MHFRFDTEMGLVPAKPVGGRTASTACTTATTARTTQLVDVESEMAKSCRPNRKVFPETAPIERPGLSGRAGVDGRATNGGGGLTALIDRRAIAGVAGKRTVYDHPLLRCAELAVRVALPTMKVER